MSVLIIIKNQKQMRESNWGTWRQANYFDILCGEDKLTIYCNLRSYDVPVQSMPAGEILISNYDTAGADSVLRPYEARVICG